MDSGVENVHYFGKNLSGGLYSEIESTNTLREKLASWAAILK